MTTTAHEDQFIAAPEPVREPMSREAILRRNIASLEVALRTQTERAEAAEECKNFGAFENGSVIYKCERVSK